MPYYLKLDGLRGIAILGVFIAHWITPVVGMTLPYGSMGVRLFFVLSGFLITGILLRTKKDIEQGSQSLGYSLKAFYIRRSLRIFAVYYAWILLTCWGDWNVETLSYLLYFSNIYDIIYHAGGGNHYWSLALEEQFYIIWPWLIFLCSTYRLKKMFYLFIGVGVATRLIGAILDVDYLVLKKIPFTCFDAMALGGLIAYYRNEANHQACKKYYKIALYLGGILFVIAISSLHVWGKNCFGYAGLAHTSFALLGVMLIMQAIDPVFQQKWLSGILMFKPLRYLGLISYGCYLFHQHVHLKIDQLLLRIGLDPKMELGVSFILSMLGTILIASISWYFFEKPVNALKRNFPMKAKEI